MKYIAYQLIKENVYRSVFNITLLLTSHINRYWTVKSNFFFKYEFNAVLIKNCNQKWRVNQSRTNNIIFYKFYKENVSLWFYIINNAK